MSGSTLDLFSDLYSSEEREIDYQEKYKEIMPVDNGTNLVKLNKFGTKEGYGTIQRFEHFEEGIKKSTTSSERIGYEIAQRNHCKYDKIASMY